MANHRKVMESVKDFLTKMKALDEAIPEELAQDALEMTENIKDALGEETEAKSFEEAVEKPEEKEAKVEDNMEDIIVKILEKYGIIKDDTLKALDELEEECEVVRDADGEEEVTVDPEIINDSAKKEIIRAIKPVIASVSDSATRRKLSDAFAGALKAKKETTTDYAALLKIARSNIKDSANKISVNNNSDYGMEIAKKYNPHYKEV